MKKSLMLVICTVALSSITLESNAQCSNTATPSCGVYEACFARHCKCSSSSDEYFISYGKKYCSRFLDASGFSQAGKLWRDATLRCLQEKIVPKLDLSGSGTCNCGEMRQFAFDTHIACYTQPNNSVCNLPIDDLDIIGSLVETKDAFSREGWRTFLKIARTCMTQATGQEQRQGWKRVADAIGSY